MALEDDGAVVEWNGRTIKMSERKGGTICDVVIEGGSGHRHVEPT